MSNAAFNKIIEKFQLLDTYVKYIEELKKLSLNEFINDHKNFGIAERYLQLAIQILIDVSKILIVTQNIEKPDQTTEIFEVLRKQKIIKAQLEGNLQGIIGFRNILVHEYGKIDRTEVFNKMNHNIKDLKTFKKQVLKFINK